MRCALIDTWKGELDQAESNGRVRSIPQASEGARGSPGRTQTAGFLDGAAPRATGQHPGLQHGSAAGRSAGQLLGSIDRVLAAPTPYQIEHFNELRAEFIKDMGEVNGFAERQIPEINDLLKKYNAGSLMAESR